MDIIVCIKQVPETTDVKIDPKTNTLIREGVAAMINPFDMYAIEEALRIKERMSGKVIAISMGPSQTEDALRAAIAMGADEAVLLCDVAFAGADTLATSYTLACAIKKLGNFDIIICGKQASDGDTAQVGPGISVHLDTPQVTYVKKIEEIQNGFAKVERMTETGYEVIQVLLPALFTVVKEINEPRLPSLKGMMRAKKAKVKVWTHKEIEAEPAMCGLDGSPTQVIRIFTPPPRPGSQILSGSPAEVADKLVDLLKKEIV